MPPQLKLQPLEAQATSASAALAPELEATRPAFAKLLTRLARSILEKRALSSEDLIDFCTLKGNHGDQRGHFAMALDIFERADVSGPFAWRRAASLSWQQEMAAGRARVALQTIWRRAFLHEKCVASRSAKSRGSEVSVQLERVAERDVAFRRAGLDLPS